MLVDSPPEASAVTAPAPPDRRALIRSVGLLASVLVLVAVLVASIAVGAKPLSLDQVWHGLFQDTGNYADVVVGERISRTLLGLLAGVALGLAGAVLQALTRNPLADPGILGINMGASAAVVSAISFFGVTSLTGYVWFAFAGAAAVGVLVYALGGTRNATPVRLALAGTAINAALSGYLYAVMITDDMALNRMRFWQVGSLATSTMHTVQQVWPFIAVGAVLALLLSRPLNAMAMGDDTARALGVRVQLSQSVLLVASVLLAAMCVTAAGPIGFVAFVAPQVTMRIARTAGPPLLASALTGAALVVGSDYIARVLLPIELPVGIITTAIGGPFLMYLIVRTNRRLSR